MKPYTSRAQVPLITLHGELSKLHHAVNLLFEDLYVDITIQWRNGTYLTVNVECREKDKQKVVDRLNHGALTGEYDYRFSTGYPTGNIDPDDWVVVTGYVDLHHPRPERKAA